MDEQSDRVGLDRAQAVDGGATQLWMLSPVDQVALERGRRRSAAGVTACLSPCADDEPSRRCCGSGSEIASVWRVLRSSAAGVVGAGATTTGFDAGAPAAGVAAGAGAPTSGREPDRD